MIKSKQFQNLNPDGRRNMKLHPFTELAKQITNSPFCEIDIMDEVYHSTLANNEIDINDTSLRSSVCHETIRKKGIHEIKDLTKVSRYKNLPYVKGTPYLRYYCGIKLTDSTGKDIGSVSVYDFVPKRISKEQKIQFKLLAHAIMVAIESEFNHRKSFGKLEAFRDNLHKLNHDLNSPINGIISMADLLIENKEEVNVQTQDIKIIKKSAQSIIGIINDVLATQDVDKNKEKLMESKPLSAVLEKIGSLYKPLALDKNITLSLSNQMGSGVRAPYFFSIKVLRILGNLVSNAIKFSPRNAAVDVVLSVKRDGNKGDLNIVVNNRGEVLSQKQISSFKNGNPVERPNETSRNKSFGIGLQHVHQMISEEKGSVEIESTKDSGTTFSISLPLPFNEKNREVKPASIFSNGLPKPTVNGTKPER